MKGHDDELDDDIREHIELETEDNVARGMSREEARYAALRKFGNVTRVKEQTRAGVGLGLAGVLAARCALCAAEFFESASL